MKDKAKAQQARKMKASEKAKKRRTEYLAKKARAHSEDGPSDKAFPAETRLFWLAHGVNCLLSDYAKGLWTPLFDGIYEGKLPESQEAIQMRVFHHFEGLKEPPPAGKAAQAWTVSDPQLLYIYWREAQRRMQRAHPDLEEAQVLPLLRRPRDGCVWGLFDYLMGHMIKNKSI